MTQSPLLAPSPAFVAEPRSSWVRRGQMLSRLTLAYNSFEGLASVTIGVMAGSISLVGFGIDSVIEVMSSVAALWRLRADADPVRRETTERRTLRFIGVSFLALSVYILIDAGHALYFREPPQRTVPGIIIATLSLMIMPLLARAKRRVASALGSRALAADAMQTNLCTWLSAIVLIGVGLNTLFGWWWADPLAAICMTPIIAKEGIAGLRGEDHCSDCHPVRVESAE